MILALARTLDESGERDARGRHGAYRIKPSGRTNQAELNVLARCPGVCDVEQSRHVVSAVETSERYAGLNEPKRPPCERGRRDPPVQQSLDGETIPRNELRGVAIVQAITQL